LQQELIAQVKASALLQVDLARRTGYSQKHISQVLNGRVEGTLTMWQSLIDATQDQRDVHIYRCDGCGRRVRRDGNDDEISSYCDRLGETRKLIREKLPEEL
jgi:predicted transcriptional regulator